MSNRKRILIPVDGSDFSLQVLDSVKELLPPEECHLILLTIEPEPAGLIAGPAQVAPLTGTGYMAVYSSHRDVVRAHHPIYATQEQASTTAAVHSALQTTVRHLEAYGYTVEVAVRFGEPLTEILNYIDSTTIDLIAMSTHGRTGIGRLVFGSIAMEILRRVNIPMLLLHPSSMA